MSLSTVLYLFLSHLGVGIAATLVLVSRGAGVKFFRFNAGLAAILIAVGIVFHQHGTSPADVDASLGDSGLLALEIAEAAIVIYWATVGRALARVRPAIVAVAVGA